MPRFILLDHWLKSVGGHNYQYAIDLLSVAAEQGCEPVLVTHQQFTPGEPEQAWQVLPVFRDGAKRRDWLGPDGRCHLALSPEGRPLPLHAEVARHVGSQVSYQLARVHHRLTGRQQPAKIERYAATCGTVFQSLGFRSDDIVFCPSMSEFDLLGLVRFLASTPASKQVSWHLQFHFDIFAGRQHTYASQRERMLRFRQQFESALGRVPDHDLRFYATTEPMAQQYQCLQIGDFRSLPWPTRSGQDIGPRSSTHPLRLTCAGSVRREKGRAALRTTIERLRPQLLAGEFQIAFQTNPRNLKRLLDGRFPPAPIAKRLDPQSQAPVLPIQFPLPDQDYLELIESSHLGLFLYDPERYYARCSGVLVEMLAAGVPVVVPAGCWLGDQVDMLNYAYLECLRASTPWAAVLPDQTSTDHVSFQLKGTGQLLIRAEWNHRQIPHLELRLTRSGKSTSSILSGPEQNQAAALLAIPAGSGPVQLSARDAFADGEPVCAVMQIEQAPEGTHHLPRAAAGLTWKRAAEVPTLVAEIAAEYQHYATEAGAAASQWRAKHAPSRTLEILAACSKKRRVA